MGRGRGASRVWHGSLKLENNSLVNICERALVELVLIASQLVEYGPSESQGLVSCYIDWKDLGSQR